MLAKKEVRVTRWTKKDAELLPWLLCDYIDYSAQGTMVRKVYQGQFYEERKKCGKPIVCIIENGRNVLHRCAEHKKSS